MIGVFKRDFSDAHVAGKNIEFEFFDKLCCEAGETRTSQLFFTAFLIFWRGLKKF